MTRLRVLVPVAVVLLASIVGSGYAVAQGTDGPAHIVEPDAQRQRADTVTTPEGSPIELPETQKCMADSGYQDYLGTGNLEGPIAEALDGCLPEPKPQTPDDLAAMRADVARFTDHTVRCMTAQGFHPTADAHPQGGTFDPPGSGFVITYPDGEMLSDGFAAASKQCDDSAPTG